MADPGDTEPLDSAPRTAWHPMLVALLERFLPRGFKLLSEFQLTRLPQRADIVVVRLLEAPAGRPEKIHSILDYLRAHTLIEHKGPTDDLTGEDLLTLLGYGYQYMRLAKVDDPAEICLMVVADRLTRSFLTQVERCRADLVETESGLWQGQLGGFALHGVETSKVAGLRSTERLLYTFSRAYVGNPMGIQRLDPQDLKVYVWLYQQVEQFKRARGAMAVKDMDTLSKTFAEVIQSLEPELRKQILSTFTLEQRLEGLKPEERLEGLKPEERLAGIEPEELLRGLSPEQREQLKRLLH
jgi:hypothetical protein